jgi:TonB family protein
MTYTTWNVALPRWPWRRLLPAIGLSLLVHVLIVDNWRPSAGTQPSGAVPAPLQARLETAEPMAMPAADLPDIPLEPDRARPAAGVQPPAPRMTPVAPMTGTPLTAGAGASVPDPRFYQARELDRYPVPLAPLNLQAVAGLSGNVRLWLSIDLTGNVVDVSVADADPTAALESMARESLLATRFMPAMKNERPVKSRILLELRYGR